MAIELPYGTSVTLPRVHGVHLHHWCCDQDLDVLGWQIREMIRWGSQSVRDNNITGVAEHIGNNQPTRDALLDYYGNVFCPALLGHGLFPFAVLLDRNWSGPWTGGGSPPAGLLTNTERDNILSHAGSMSAANRVTLNVGIFGDTENVTVDSIRTWWLDEAQAIAEACPLGTWFQAFNGPETTHLFNVFVTPWDFAPQSGTTGSTNRSWAANGTTGLGVTMISDAEEYIEAHDTYVELMRDRIEAAGHPPERLIAGGVHPYQLENEVSRCAGISDPDDPATMPENSVCSEYGVTRLPVLPNGRSVPIGDPDLEYRSFGLHVERMKASRPRAAYLHSPIDGRRADLWQLPRATVNNWTKDGYFAWIWANPLSPKETDAYAAYHLLSDEPHLRSEVEGAARSILIW